jgi:hypothetical protein
MSKKLKQRNTIQKVAPVCRIKDTQLRNVCEVTEKYIPNTELSAAITDLPKMDRRFQMLKIMEFAFLNTIEELRKLDYPITAWSDGVVQISAPLRQVSQILGIFYPDANGEKGYESVRKLCAKFGIGEDDIIQMQEEDYGVPANKVVDFIKAAQLPSAITVRLVDWFTSFLNEKTAGAPWSPPWRKDVDVPDETKATTDSCSDESVVITGFTTSL